MIFEQYLPQNTRIAFTNKVRAISSKYGFDAEWLMIVMAFETAKTFRTGSHGNGATGLIGFRSQTAIELGTTQAQLAQMSQVQQLDYVDKYLNKWKAGSKVNSLADLYIIVFTPAYAGYSQSFVIGSQNGTSTQRAIYQANPAFKNAKGYFTIADIGATIARWANYTPMPTATAQTNSVLLFLVLIVIVYIFLK
ncbi:MAG: hypothetical protein LCH91_18110 [Bacteroidetes bacterium]|nr:hypothetical protein [Bacteroidota bacterium]